MEMKVDQQVIRRQRQRRAWSQEHLANIAELGLRTIQRIETTGFASFESIRAIAAALSVPVSELTVETKVASRAVVRRSRVVKAATAVSAAMVVAISALLTRNVFEDDVMLNVGLTLNDQARQGVLPRFHGRFS